MGVCALKDFSQLKVESSKVTGKQLLAFLQSLSQEDLEKEVVTYSVSVGDYGDEVSEVFMEPLERAAIVIASK